MQQSQKELYRWVQRFNNGNPIPENWTVSELGNIVELRGRIGWKGLTKKDYRENGPLFIGVTNISTNFSLDLSDITRISEERYDESPEIMVQVNDILLAKSGTIGRVCLVEKLNEKATVNSAVNILRCKENVVPKFLFYFLSWSRIQKKLFQMSAAGVQANLFQKDIRRLPILLPTIREQQKIQSILSKVDELIEKTDQVIEQTRRLKKGLMQKLLTRGIAHTKFKKEYFPFKSIVKEIPFSWKILKLEELSKVVRGSSPRPAGDPKYFGGKIPWITVSELTKDDNIYLDAVSEGLTELGKENSRFLNAGVVLLANSGATLGKPKILNIAGCVNDGVAAFLNLSKDIVPEFLYYVLLSWVKVLRSINQGVYQLNINTEIIGNLYFPLPPVEEQREIISIMLDIDKYILRLDEYRLKLNKLKKGLMQKLLTGKIRVIV